MVQVFHRSLEHSKFKDSYGSYFKALGIKTSGSRRMAHTAEFRKYEQAHPDYERAEAFIKKIASKL